MAALIASSWDRVAVSGLAQEGALLGRAPTRIDEALDRLPKAELLAMARERGVVGTSRMRKQELVRALASHERTPAEEARG